MDKVPADPNQAVSQLKMGTENTEEMSVAETAENKGVFHMILSSNIDSVKTKLEDKIKNSRFTSSKDHSYCVAVEKPLLAEAGDNSYYCILCSQSYQGRCPRHGMIICINQVQEQPPVTENEPKKGEEEPEENQNTKGSYIEGLLQNIQESPLLPKGFLQNEMEMSYVGELWQIQVRKLKSGVLPGCVNSQRNQPTVNLEVTETLTEKSADVAKDVIPVLAEPSVLVVSESMNLVKKTATNLNGKIHLANSESAGQSRQGVVAVEPVKYTKMVIQKKVKYGKRLGASRIHGKMGYKCSICGSEFKHYENQVLHMKIYHGLKIGQSLNKEVVANPAKKVRRRHRERRNVCDVCGKGYVSLSSLEAHKREHTGEGPFVCTVCGMRFTRNDHLRGHTWKHIGKPHTCDQCGKTFIHLRNLRQHLEKDSHDKEAAGQCPGEDEDRQISDLDASDNQSGLGRMVLENKSGKNSGQDIHVNKTKKDMLSSSGDKSHVCDICGASFQRPIFLKFHKIRHTGEAPFQCKVCSAKFACRFSLMGHARKHGTRKSYECTVCGQKFASVTLLLEHKLTHSHDELPAADKKSVKCDICGVFQVSSTALKVHKRTHTDERNYECEICGFKFIQLAHLKTHIKIHTGERPFKCDLCGKAYIRNNDLKKHKCSPEEFMLEPQDINFTYCCDVCYAIFSEHSQYDEHMKMHIDEASFRCSFCFVDFGSLEELCLHKSSSTECSVRQNEFLTAEELFKCNLCSIECISGHGLNLHMLSSHGESSGGTIFPTNKPKEKSAVCDECGRQCVNRTQLQLHQYSHTPDKPYIVDACDTEFPDSSLLLDHHTIPPDDQIYGCDTCDAQFATSYLLTLHQRSHTGEKPFMCSTCGESFVTNNKLLSHRATHLKGDKYKCDVCGVCMSTSYYLKVHKIKRHSVDRSFRCNICQTSFKVRTDLNVHIRTHTGEKPFTCTLCDSRFHCRKLLRKHRFAHMNHTPYSCQVCDAQFEHLSSLARHEKKHGNKIGPRLYRCEFCSVEFNRRCDYTLHKRSHTGDTPHRCDVCGLMFVYKAHLVKHVQKHEKLQQPLSCETCGIICVCDKLPMGKTQTCSLAYKCEHCGDYFGDVEQLNDHKINHCQMASSSDINVKCGGEDFNIEAIQAEDLTLNVDVCNLQLVTSGEKTKKGSAKVISCDVCGISFNSACRLEVHRRFHTGERPYLCDICGTSFFMSSHLTKHKKIHTGEKPFECEQCGMRFSSNSSLRKHQMKHLQKGEKPYACNLCGDKFTDQKNLVRHMKIQSKQGENMCDVCGQHFCNKLQVRQHRKVHQAG